MSGSYCIPTPLCSQGADLPDVRAGPDGGVLVAAPARPPLRQPGRLNRLRPRVRPPGGRRLARRLRVMLRPGKY